MQHDVYLIHAPGRTDEFAEDLYDALVQHNAKTWYAPNEVKVGASIGEAIREALQVSRYAVVILDRSFFQNPSSRDNLHALFASEVGQKQRILPIRYALTTEELSEIHPILGDRHSLNADEGVDEVANAIIERIQVSGEGEHIREPVNNFPGQFRTPVKLSSVALFTALVFMGISLTIGVIIPCPSSSLMILLRINLSVALAAFAAAIPGLIHIHLQQWLNLGGAFFIFVVTYFFNPASMVAQRGCDDPYPVTGTVQINGKLAQGVEVTLLPMEKTGITNAHGKFTIEVAPHTSVDRLMAFIQYADSADTTISLDPWDMQSPLEFSLTAKAMRKAEVNTRSFTVGSHQPTQTFIHIDPHDEVSISVSGTILVGKTIGIVGPEGKTTGAFGISISDYNIEPSLPHGAVMYRTANYDNWKFCGSQAHFRAADSGSVEFMVNDLFTGDNTGSFDAILKIKRYDTT